MRHENQNSTGLRPAPKVRLKTRLVPGSVRTLFSVVLLATFGVLLNARAARSQVRNAATLPPVLRNVGIDQKLNQQVPLDIPFRDETGNVVRLGDYFGSTPVVLSLV